MSGTDGAEPSAARTRPNTTSRALTGQPPVCSPVSPRCGLVRSGRVWTGPLGAVPPPLAKRMPRDLRQLAHLRPALHAGGVAGERPAAGPGEPLRALVALLRRERAAHRVHGQRLGAQLGLLLAHDPAAQVDQHARDVDLD